MRMLLLCPANLQACTDVRHGHAWAQLLIHQTMSVKSVGQGQSSGDSE